jgi:hypothetical protein
VGYLKIVNIVLVALAVVLALNLLLPFNSLVGNVIYKLDKSEPKCYFSNAADLREIPTDACCFELQKQLACTQTGVADFNIKCYTSESSGTYYLVNNKLVALCNMDGFNVKVS